MSGSAAPVLRDVAEQAVLDPVPLRCARRIGVDVDRKSGLVGELLQFDFPEPHARPIRAAAVRRYRQLSRLRIALSFHAFEPAADRRHGKLGGVAGDPDADERRWRSHHTPHKARPCRQDLTKGPRGTKSSGKITGPAQSYPALSMAFHEFLVAASTESEADPNRLRIFQGR